MVQKVSVTFFSGAPRKGHGAPSNVFKEQNYGDLREIPLHDFRCIAYSLLVGFPANTGTTPENGFLRIFGSLFCVIDYLLPLCEARGCRSL